MKLRSCNLSTLGPMWCSISWVNVHGLSEARSEKFPDGSMKRRLDPGTLSSPSWPFADGGGQ